jgi:hypothetical protein
LRANQLRGQEVPELMVSHWDGFHGCGCWFSRSHAARSGQKKAPPVRHRRGKKS